MPHRQWLLQTTRTDQTVRMHALQSTPTHENVNHSPYQRSQNAQGVLRVGVEQAIEHPSYNPATLGHDAMILKLARAVHDRTTVALPPAGERLQDRAQVQVMGWGTTAFGGPLSDLLLEVELQVTPQTTCEGVYGPLREEMMCAAGPNKDACQGDSGGPLLKAGTALQYGIVSFGVDCGIYPGVYTRTTAPNVHDWIVAIARLSTHPSTPPPMGSPPEPHPPTPPPTPPPALDPPAMPPTIVFPPFDHAGRRLPSPGIRARWLVAWSHALLPGLTRIATNPTRSSRMLAGDPVHDPTNRFPPGAWKVRLQRQGQGRPVLHPNATEEGMVARTRILPKTKAASRAFLGPNTRQPNQKKRLEASGTPGTAWPSSSAFQTALLATQVGGFGALGGF
eukprot:scaffold717_cov402-Pavlova_lutheri.AAC.5